MFSHLGKSLWWLFSFSILFFIINEPQIASADSTDRADRYDQAADTQCHAGGVYDEQIKNLKDEYDKEDKLRSKASLEAHHATMKYNRAQTQAERTATHAEWKEAEEREKKHQKRLDDLEEQIKVATEKRNTHLAACAANRAHAANQRTSDKNKRKPVAANKPKPSASDKPKEPGFWEGFKDAVDRDMARNRRVFNGKMRTVAKWKDQIVDLIPGSDMGLKPIWDFKE